ncbi:hypothetical protein BV210_19195 (plasmid) [Halorientalis sp. IM1011]|uniref:DUF1616 domain-containing protein n=1 Tax=Halorientalis sp. IM1011 TaxID=1932360 RepID=UPI00097CC456|nr:DUF1616 domain-containing protein [Halorientalis sp. IM1011]AQL44887.1 hypothetical protein BV210_19195 [Halorientalis sp. IM1011]
MRESLIRSTGDGVLGTVRGRIQSAVRQVPTDLVLVVAFALGAVSLLTVGVSSPLVRAVLGFPLLFLVPGYVTVAAAFPRARSGTLERTGALGQVREVSGVERAALSFGLSVALLPLLALAIDVSPWPFESPVRAGAVSGYAGVMAAVAVYRRAQVSDADRYRWHVGRTLASIRTALAGTSKRETVLNLLVAVSLVAATGAVGYALATPQDGEQYSTISILTENESGDRVAGDYPTDLDTADDRRLVAAVENREGRETTYELVVVVERVDPSGEDNRVTERAVLSRGNATVPPGGTWYYRHGLRPVLDGENLRVSYFLYEGDAPATPTPESASQHAYFWVSAADETP